MRLVRLPLGESSVAGACAKLRQSVRVADAYSDPRFNKEVDTMTGLQTRTILASPIISQEGELLGVVQCINKSAGPFTQEDEKVLNTLALHIAIFIECNT